MVQKNNSSRSLLYLESSHLRYASEYDLREWKSYMPDVMNASVNQFSTQQIYPCHLTYNWASKSLTQQAIMLDKVGDVKIVSRGKMGLQLENCKQIILKDKIVKQPYGEVKDQKNKRASSATDKKGCRYVQDKVSNL